MSEQINEIAEKSVLPAIGSVTSVDLLVTPDSQVIIAYSKPFEKDELPIQGEYDFRTKKLWFYTDNGLPREFGIEITRPVEKLFHQRDFRAKMICIRDQKIYQFLHIPILINEGT